MHQRLFTNVYLLPMAVRKVKVQSSSSDKGGGGGGKADALAFHKAEQMFSVCSSVIEQ